MIARAHLRNYIRFAMLAVPKVVKLLTVLLVDALIARHLGTDGFGLFSLLLAVFMTLAMLVKFGLDNVLVRDTVLGKLNPERIAQVWAVRICAAILGQAAFLVIAMSVPIFREHLPYLLVVSFGLLALGFSIFEPQMQGDERFGLLAIAQTLVILAGAAAKLFFLVYDPRVELFSLSLAIEAIISAAITAAYLLYSRLLPRAMHFRGVFRSAVRGYATEGLPYLLGGLSVIAFMRIDQFMLAAMSGKSSVGAYSAALRISEAFFALATLASSVIFPTLMRMKTRAQRDYEVGLIQALRVSMVVALVISILLTIFSRPIVILIYGADYEASVLLLALHGWAMLPAFWGVITHRWLVAENLGKHDFYRNLIGLAVNLIGNLILIPLYGAAGACVATILAQLVAYIGANAIFPRLRPLLKLQRRAIFFFG